jgi:hypothetical protein
MFLWQGLGLNWRGWDRTEGGWDRTGGGWDRTGGGGAGAELERGWDRTGMEDSQILRSLVESMPKRLLEVIERGENTTHY